MASLTVFLPLLPLCHLPPLSLQPPLLFGVERYAVVESCLHCPREVFGSYLQWLRIRYAAMMLFRHCIPVYVDFLGARAVCQICFDRICWGTPWLYILLLSVPWLHLVYPHFHSWSRWLGTQNCWVCVWVFMARTLCWCPDYVELRVNYSIFRSRLCLACFCPV